MSVTASRLGSAPLLIDWSNLVAGVKDGGKVDTQETSAAWSRLKARFASGEVGFYDAPINDDLSQAQESQKLADALLQRKTFTDCLFLGIGGSSLGPMSLLSALQERCSSGVKFHFIENPDPLEWKSTVSNLNPGTTLVCAVTKSGTTFETMSQVLLALEWLGKQRVKSHFVAITDPSKGDLRAFAAKEGIATLSIAPPIGGRFSVFSPVGLFPVALAGLSVPDFMLGAKQVRDYCEKHALEKNPIMILASELLRQAGKRPIHVCMPYSTRLRALGAWFVQLWGESLGKDGKGFTPLAAVGATDQHSLLQLLRDGPDDKITFFVTVDRVDDEVKIPHLTSVLGVASRAYPAFQILEGHTLQELLSTEYRATSLVLSKQKRPNLTLALDRLDERSLGAFYFSLSTLTAVTGTLWGVNPFDQPGVEEGKVYIREALGANSPGGSKAKTDDDDNSPVARLRRGRDQDS